MDADRVAQLDALLAAWTAAYGESNTTQAAARSAVAAKAAVGDRLRRSAADLLRRMRYDEALSDEDRQAVGLGGRDSERRSVDTPESRPGVELTVSDRLTHTIRTFDASAPGRRSRPPGVAGAEVYRFIGNEVPQDPSRFDRVGTMTRRRDRFTYPADRAGEVAHYLLRWVTRDGRPGPWGQVVSGTIPAV